MFQLLWNLLAYQGVNYVRKPSHIKHIVLLNSITIFLILFSILNNLLLVFVIGIPFFITIINIIYPISLILNLVFNSKGYLQFTRIYFLTVSHIYLVIISYLLGTESDAHFYLLTEALVAFFVFPHEKKKNSILILGIILSSFVFFEFYQDFLPKFTDYTLPFSNYVRIINHLTFMVILIGFTFYISNIFKKAELSLELEHEKSEKLLQNILPESIIEKLRDNPDTIAEHFEECTVLFSDIVGFTELSRRLPAKDLVVLLNEIFSSFDDLAGKYGLEKIKTIGDAYMVAGGLPDRSPVHAEKVAEFALDMLSEIQSFREKSGYAIQLRIGIHSGGAIAGVIGKKKFIYDLWGTSVNTASRMESHGIPGQIQVSEMTYLKLKEKFEFMERGYLDVKGIGTLRSFFLVRKL